MTLDTDLESAFRIKIYVTMQIYLDERFFYTANIPAFH